jgi:short subunit dehydrogenase-like uncharacterized protein
MRIVVIGGAGYLGSRAVSALRRAPGVEVVPASRRARAERHLVVDLARPETFDALADADVVVNASSSHAAPPDALARHCLAKGLVLLEASSDIDVVERLLDAHRGASHAGTLVLGAGLFTGVSNALAAEVARALPGAESIEVGVRSSPLSGAGGGTIDLMVDALATHTRVVRGGARRDMPGIAAGPALPFLEGEAKTLSGPFPEPLMLHASTGVPNVAMYLAPVPSFVRLLFLATPAILFRSALVRWVMRGYLRLVRAVLFARVGTRVGLVARATRGGESRTMALSTSDGFAAAGAAIAATALALARSRPAGGTFTVDECVGLEAMLDGCRALMPELGLELRRA